MDFLSQILARKLFTSNHGSREEIRDVSKADICKMKRIALAWETSLMSLDKVVADSIFSMLGFSTSMAIRLFLKFTSTSLILL
jgi:hypothetical protein